MCYGFQAMAQGLGGEVAHTGAREYGRTPVDVSGPAPCSPASPREHNVWMSHGDSVTAAPEGFDGARRRPRDPGGGVRGRRPRLAGVQWHPEVLHTEHGQKVLEHFLHDIAGCRQTWTMVNIVEEQIERIREQIGDTGGRSAGSPAASTRPWRRRSCSRRSATG